MTLPDPANQDEDYAWREMRLAAALPPEAAMVLPLMLALARIQARRNHAERVR